MKKIYHLANCSTCQRIITEIKPGKDVELQNIKEEKITAKQLDQMKKLGGSYESLFSRKAMKYRSLGLADKNLKEKEYRQLILDEYTFLKRPVIIQGNEIFIGNAKKVVEGAKAALNK